MENYIGDFKQSSSKNHYKSRNNIKKRTDENAMRIDELAKMRDEQTKRKANLNDYDKEIQG